MLASGTALTALLVSRCEYLVPLLGWVAFARIIWLNYRSLIACGLYYLVWAKVLPKWKGYSLRQEVVDLGQGAEAHKIAKVPNAQIADWDANHDTVGRLRQRFIHRSESEGEKLANTSLDPDSKNAIVVESAASSV